MDAAVGRRGGGPRGDAARARWRAVAAAARADDDPPAPALPQSDAGRRPLLGARDALLLQSRRHGASSSRSTRTPATSPGACRSAIFEELEKKGIKTGTPSLGGAITTAGDLVFIGATIDGYFRAFDARNGKELWSTKLEAPGARDSVHLHG